MNSLYCYTEKMTDSNVSYNSDKTKSESLSQTISFHNDQGFVSRENSPMSPQEFLWPIDSGRQLSPLPQEMLSTSPGYWTLSHQDQPYHPEHTWAPRDSSLSPQDYVFVYYYCGYRRQLSVQANKREMPSIVDHNQNTV